MELVRVINILLHAVQEACSTVSSSSALPLKSISTYNIVQSSSLFTLISFSFFGLNLHIREQRKDQKRSGRKQPESIQVVLNKLRMHMWIS